MTWQAEMLSSGASMGRIRRIRSPEPSPAGTTRQRAALLEEVLPAAAPRNVVLLRNDSCRSSTDPDEPAVPPSEPSTPAGWTGDSDFVRVEPRAAARASLEALVPLRDGWDGDESPAPSPESIERARDLIQNLARTPDEVDPDAVGGVALWFYFENRARLMVGIRNSGDVLLCAYEPQNPIPGITLVTEANILPAVRDRISNRA
jgi:hypothetical protein